jgi:hypothetical protein
MLPRADGTDVATVEQTAAENAEHDIERLSAVLRQEAFQAAHIVPKVISSLSFCPRSHRIRIGFSTNIGWLTSCNDHRS